MRCSRRWGSNSQLLLWSGRRLGQRLVLILGNEIVAALESGQLRTLVNEIVVSEADADETAPADASKFETVKSPAVAVVMLATLATRLMPLLSAAVADD